MKLEMQVTSLELSIKLNDLGVKQESHFYWYQQLGGIVCDTDVRGKWIIRTSEDLTKGFGKYVSAFTVAELGELLPVFIEKHDPSLKKKRSRIYTLKTIKVDNGFICGACDTPHKQFSNTEADARAKMLIYLIENKFLTT